MAQRLEIHPNPLTQGQTGQLRGEPGAKVKVDWDPDAEPSELTIGEDGKVSFTVPSNATSVAVEDEFGNTDAGTVSTP